jgi:hypothetical protein
LRWKSSTIENSLPQKRHFVLEYQSHQPIIKNLSFQRVLRK